MRWTILIKFAKHKLIKNYIGQIKKKIENGWQVKI